MKNPVCSWGLRGLLVATACAALVCTQSSAADYLEEDARLSGEQIHVFSDNGQRASVVLGSFRLTVGEITMTGRDAVVWVTDRGPGAVARRDITVYIEGDAEVVEGDSSTSDSSMLVTVRHHGRLTAVGSVSQRSLKDFPLYRRAQAARQRQEQPADSDERPEGPTRPAPPLITRPGTEEEPPTRPAGHDEEPTEDAPPPQPQPDPETTPEPERPRPSAPVNFRADSFSMQMVDEDRRVTIARGNVYLSQGEPDSDLFLELRSQSAVVFSEQRPAEQVPEDSRVPYAPDVQPVPSGEMEEFVTGVYLAGDVVISRGERMLRGPRAYYDFTTDRALVTDAVFRTIQEQRDIPVYIRAEEARALSVREMWFRDAKISTCDFETPSYHVGVSTAYVMDTTPYDPRTGEKLAERSYQGRFTNATFNILDVPLLYWPYATGDFQEGHTALRKAQVGSHGQYGFGVETEWHLFRLLGLVRPDGYSANLELNWYERGPFIGTDVTYSRDNYSGYSLAYLLDDQDGNDDFGRERKNIEAPDFRGRLLMRHKHLLPRDWQVQAELSYLCDRNFLEAFFPGEFYAGKEQETLLYAQKQRDNWAVTGLLKARLNDFLTQTESLPDVAFHWIGQPLLKDRLTFFHESRLGRLRYRPDEDLGADSSDLLVRADTRNELDLPLKAGPVNIVPYIVGRATWWEDSPSGNDECRLYGQVGARANTHLYRVFDSVGSRLWNLNRLRHVVTPEAGVFFSDTNGVSPQDLWPMDPGIEQRIDRTHGVLVGVRQRLQTKRGPEGEQQTVDWMRLNVMAGFFDNAPGGIPANGRYFASRPEYSVARNHVNADYTWHISDSTTFLADSNYDLDDGEFGRVSAALAVVRDPRLRYYAGIRHVDDLDSTIGSVGARYRISRKYTISAFQQYDFEFDGGRNMSTSFTLTRKLPRWYAATTFTYDERTGDVAFYLTLWPEGVPEFRVGSGRMSLLGTSDMN
ncbi:MAG: hypothetical protein ACP5HU_01885 [Phycisphaerae bacterium]